MLAKDYLHLGSQVERFLREHDPELPEPDVQAHFLAVGSRLMAADGSREPTPALDCTVTVYGFGRRIAENVSETESKRLAGQILG